MSKSAKMYIGAALVLIAFPLVLALWNGTSAIVAILLIGVGVYAFAVCLLVASFWHRHHFGTWPVEIAEDPTMSWRYPYSEDAALENAGPAERAGAGDADESGIRYRVSHAMLGWLRRFSSNV